MMNRLDKLKLLKNRGKLSEELSEDNFDKFVEELKGLDGKDADPEEVAEHLKLDKDFVAKVTPKDGEKGEPGKDADPISVAEQLLYNTDFLSKVKGEPGEPGKSIKGEKGDPGMVWCGEWANGKSYIKGDVVASEGSAYICKYAAKATNETQPGVGIFWKSNWDLLVQKGDRGAQGGSGGGSSSGGIQSIIAGANITVDDTDPLNPIISSSAVSSLFELNTYSSNDYIQPIDTTNNLLIGSDLTSTIATDLNAASAIFNDSVNNPGAGLNYFTNAAYGTSFLDIGGLFMSLRGRGTASSPAQTNATDYLGAHVFAGIDQNGNVTLNSANHIFPGYWSAATSNAVSTVMESKLFIGGIITPMFSFDTSTNDIKFNESQLDANMTWYYDLGIAMTLDGGTGIVDAAVGLTQGGVTVPTISSTNTLTNKRVTPRLSTTTSSATPTINTDNVDVYGLTAQTADITSFTTNLSGTPTDGQKLWIYIVGTAARAITWGSSFENGASTLPTTTVSTQRLDVGFIWNAATSKWRCMAAGSA